MEAVTKVGEVNAECGRFYVRPGFSGTLPARSELRTRVGVGHYNPTREKTTAGEASEHVRRQFTPMRDGSGDSARYVSLS